MYRLTVDQISSGQTPRALSRQRTESIRWVQNAEGIPRENRPREAGTTTLFELIRERASLTEEDAADYLRQARRKRREAAKAAVWCAPRSGHNAANTTYPP